MNRISLLVACALFAVGPVQVSAADEPFTAGYLLSLCRNSSADSKAACRFFIFGVMQGITLGINIADGKTKSERPCIPDDVTMGALELLVRGKLGEDLAVFPDDDKLDASAMVGGIIASVFGCRHTK